MKFLYYSKLFIQEHKKLSIAILLFILLFPTIRLIDYIVYAPKVQTSDELWYDSSSLVYLMASEMNYKDPFSDFTKNKINEYVSKYGSTQYSMSDEDEQLYTEVLEMNAKYNTLLLKDIVGYASTPEYHRIQELKQKFKNDYNID